MKGLVKFLRETWWIFALAAAINVVMAVTSGLWFFLFFLPILCFVAVYMSVVRYDSDGNLRGEDP